ncbi:hypothetical protein [Aquimarina sp. SS2-1]|uniref:Nmad2 family putative nucleotide modification protein n=1 Tax=Aquimarina besae TaxID=3342247 RepID=UPI00366ACCD0
MSRLLTYCIPVDDGAAPNPFFGICTLAICKPRIRSVAQIGDWVVGLGSKKVKDSKGESYEGKIVYAMKVTDIKTLEEYDEYCKTYLPEKIPNITHSDFRRRLGDCIYDYSNGGFLQRAGVHNKNNIQTDLGGKNVLLSTHFYYFGNQAIPLHPDLEKIIHQGPGHKSNANNPYVKGFIDWIETVDKSAMLNANPQLEIDFRDHNCVSKCAVTREEEGKADKECKPIC